jgi:hypothetical protein
MAGSATLRFLYSNTTNKRKLTHLTHTQGLFPLCVWLGFKLQESECTWECHFIKQADVRRTETRESGSYL